MRGVLLDSHVLLWWLGDPDRLSEVVQASLRDPGTTALVSVATLWEISIKSGNGKLAVRGDLLGSIEAARFELLPIAPQHALAAGRLPMHHRDPFDRMLVAQAMADDLTLITRDPMLARYGVPVIAA